MLKSAPRLSGLVEFARISCSFQPHFNVTEKIIIAQVRERTREEEQEKKSENLAVSRQRERERDKKLRGRPHTHTGSTNYEERVFS